MLKLRFFSIRDLLSSVFWQFNGATSQGGKREAKGVVFNPFGLKYTVFTNGGHAGKNWCLVMKPRRWRINKNCK